jgi:hypothetical protein
VTWVAAAVGLCGGVALTTCYLIGKWQGRRAAWAELASDVELRRTTLEWLAKLENMRLVGYE